MPYCVFLQTRTSGRPGGRTFDEGRAYDLPEASVRHWVVRRAATTDPQAVAKALAAEERAAPTHKTAAVADGDARPVPIPDDWRDLGWREMLALAQSFDPDARTKADAVTAIETELKWRAGDAKVAAADEKIAALDADTAKRAETK